MEGERERDGRERRGVRPTLSHSLQPTSTTPLTSLTLFSLHSTVSDLTMDGGNPVGAAVAAISVVSSGMQQILCRSLQQKHGLSANELLSNTAPAQAASLLLLGPWLDARIGGGRSVFDYAWTPGAARLLVLSCVAAVGVNVSQFACLGRFSAVSFQVRWWGGDGERGDPGVRGGTGIWPPLSPSLTLTRARCLSPSLSLSPSLHPLHHPRSWATPRR